MLAAALVVLFIEARIGTPQGQPPEASVARSADLVMQDHDDGSIDVTDALSGKLVETVPRSTNGFLRVVLAGLVRERRREDLGNPAIPFHLTRWSDGRLTIDDTATGRLIELEAFGPVNEGAFAQMLELSPRSPAK